VPGEHLLGRSLAVTNEAGTVHDARIGGRSRRVLISIHPAATLYDPSQNDTFGAALDEAIGLAGLDETSADTEGQSRLGEF
jgi:DNA polymerase